MKFTLGTVKRIGIKTGFIGTLIAISSCGIDSLKKSEETRIRILEKYHPSSMVMTVDQPSELIIKGNPPIPIPAASSIEIRLDSGRLKLEFENKVLKHTTETRRYQDKLLKQINDNEALRQSIVDKENYIVKLILGVDLINRYLLLQDF